MPSGSSARETMTPFHGSGSLRVRRACLITLSVVLALLVAGLTAVPAQAATGTVVFIKDHNVWVMPASAPSEARPITSDGTADNAYVAPTIDGDGLIYAVTEDGFGPIVRLDRDGNRVGEPFDPSPLGVIYDLEASPDGELLTYTWYHSSITDVGDVRIIAGASLVAFAYADGSDSSALPFDVSGSQSTWIDSDEVALVAESFSFDISGMATYTLGQPDAELWHDTCRVKEDRFGPGPLFPDGCVIPSDPDVNAAVDRMVTTGHDLDGGAGTLFVQTRLVVWDLGGAPPASPSIACEYTRPDDRGGLAQPAWSPDGDALVWERGPGDPLEGPVATDTGLWMASGFTSGSCEDAFASAELVVPGATSPSWGPGVGGTPGATPDGPAERIAGDDRFATASALSSAVFEPGVPAAYVATGSAFPDALAGGVAAALEGAPLLLVQADRIPSATAAELERLQPERIVVLGGDAAVSDDVETALGEHTTGAVERLAGENRYATAAAVATSFGDRADRVFIASGRNFPDALSGVPAAAIGADPILLVEPDSVPEATESALASLGPQEIVLLGGPAAVGEDVADQLSSSAAVRRWSGADRYATSATISRSTFADGAGTVFVATGAVFADALSSGAVAAKMSGPVLLTSPTSLSSEVAAEIERLSPEEIVILGGVSAVGEAVERELDAMLE